MRQWKESDLAPFAEMNSDKRVMEYFPSTLSDRESEEMFLRLSSGIEEKGWGLWAVERLKDNCFIGFVGLSMPTFEAPFTPCVEVGWRLKFDSWGHGFATEAATECIRFGFSILKLKEIVSFTAEINLRSIRVMERLGMIHDGDGDFFHPRISREDRLSKHVLYRIQKLH